MQEEGVSRKIEVCLEKYEPSEEVPVFPDEEEELQESLIEQDILVDAGAPDDQSPTMGDQAFADGQEFRLT